MKCVCFNGSGVNSIRRPTLFSFALKVSPGHRIRERPKLNNFKKTVTYKTFNPEDDDKDVVDFRGETLSSTIRLIVTWKNFTILER